MLMPACIGVASTASRRELVSRASPVQWLDAPRRSLSGWLASASVLRSSGGWPIHSELGASWRSHSLALLHCCRKESAALWMRGEKKRTYGQIGFMASRGNQTYLYDLINIFVAQCLTLASLTCTPVCYFNGSLACSFFFFHSLPRTPSVRAYVSVSLSHSPVCLVCLVSALKLHLLRCITWLRSGRGGQRRGEAVEVATQRQTQTHCNTTRLDSIAMHMYVSSTRWSH